jgi:hypothetical protein
MTKADVDEYWRRVEQMKKQNEDEHEDEHEDELDDDWKLIMGVDKASAWEKMKHLPLPPLSYANVVRECTEVQAGVEARDGEGTYLSWDFQRPTRIVGIVCLPLSSRIGSLWVGNHNQLVAPAPARLLLPRPHGERFFDIEVIQPGVRVKMHVLQPAAFAQLEVDVVV